MDDVVGEDWHYAENGEELGLVLRHSWAGFDGVVAGVVRTRRDLVDNECVCE